MTDSVETADPAPAAEDRGARRARAINTSPVKVCLGLVRWLAMLTGAGAALRLLVVPSPAEALAAWLAVTALLAIPVYRAMSPRAREKPGPGITWQPGEPHPAGVALATILAAERIFEVARGRRYRGAWLEVAPCTDPVRHGMCHRASATPGGDGMVRVVLGEHVARNPRVAAFTVAHEIRHPTGWTYHPSVLASCARQAGLLAAGWAVPWPWLLAAVAAVQVAYAAASWAIEIGCDIGATRSEGRSAASASVAYYRHTRNGDPRAWMQLATWLLIHVSVPVAHPPLRLRGIITSLVPASGPDL